MFPKLDPILHSELRLAVMSILAGVEDADFSFIKKQTGATSGNLTNFVRRATSPWKKASKERCPAPPAASQKQAFKPSATTSQPCRNTCQPANN